MPSSSSRAPQEGMEDFLQHRSGLDIHQTVCGIPSSHLPWDRRSREDHAGVSG
ncbi:MAG: hypothetical protein PHH80_09990 [Sphaerochaetaceae bacterium]|nr:hypothetical protein [Sphaerochaetaceae bacterium]